MERGNQINVRLCVWGPEAIFHHVRVAL
jgi:hypothetical protein